MEWRGKEPSWRRVGKRLVVDMGTKNSPSYSVEIVGQEGREPIVITVYSVKLLPNDRDWWYRAKRDEILTV